jgi:hypothetical protein
MTQAAVQPEQQFSNIKAHTAPILTLVWDNLYFVKINVEATNGTYITVWIEMIGWIKLEHQQWLQQQ